MKRMTALGFFACIMIWTVLASAQPTPLDVSDWSIDDQASITILAQDREPPLRAFFHLRLDESNSKEGHYISMTYGSETICSQEGCMIESELVHHNKTYIVSSYTMSLEQEPSTFPPVLALDYQGCYIEKSKTDGFVKRGTSTLPVYKGQEGTNHCPDEGVLVTARLEYQIRTFCEVDEHTFEWGQPDTQEVKRGELLARDESWPSQVPEVCKELIALLR